LPIWHTDKLLAQLLQQIVDYALLQPQDFLLQEQHVLNAQQALC
jgi:hypothetical protein